MLHFTWLSDRSGQDENIFILDEWGLTATPINQYKPLINLTESNCFVFLSLFCSTDSFIFGSHLNDPFPVVLGYLS